MVTGHTTIFWSSLKISIDVLNHVYPEFDYVFYHSNIHDRKQLDGLSLTKFNLGFGGTQHHMRDSIITPKLLGLYHTYDFPSQVGSKESMQFKSSNPGPYNLTEKEREAKGYNRGTGELSEHDVLWSNLKKNLKESRIKDSPRKLNKLQQMAKSCIIPVKHQKKKMILDG